MYGPEARAAMVTELPGQNAWTNRGPHGEHNRTASAADTRFADQKTALLPDDIIGAFGNSPRRNRDIELLEENPTPGIIVEGLPRLPRDD